jgi:hypothetical protein
MGIRIRRAFVGFVAVIVNKEKWRIWCEGMMWCSRGLRRVQIERRVGMVERR